MRLVNLTPHTVNIYLVADLVELGKPGSNQWGLPLGGATPYLSIEPAVTPATAPRVGVNHVPAGELDGVPLFRPAFGGGVYNLPAPVEGTVYIVSALVFNAAPDRKDLATVLGGVKDLMGRICGCVGLAVR